jgi:uncharacterized protein YjbI with pentapeptide repeats
MLKNYEESIEQLRSQGIVSPEEQLVIPERMPQYDDEEITGLSFFKTLIEEDIDLSNLSIPRTFINRSVCKNVSFENTDAHDSNFSWNDFTDVNFSGGIFDTSDFRSSNYKNCNFTLSSLVEVDMRHANFESCNFDKATINKTILSKRQLSSMHLSQEQTDSIDLREDDGPEPNGG